MQKPVIIILVLCACVSIIVGALVAAGVIGGSPSPSPSSGSPSGTPSGTPSSTPSGTPSRTPGTPSGTPGTPPGAYSGPSYASTTPPPPSTTPPPPSSDPYATGLWDSTGCTFPDAGVRKSDTQSKASYCKYWCKGREADPCCSGLGMDSDTLPSILQGMCCAGRGEPPINGKQCCTGLTKDFTGLCNPACVPSGQPTTTERPFCCEGLVNGATLGGVCSAPTGGTETPQYGVGESSYAVADF